VRAVLGRDAPHRMLALDVWANEWRTVELVRAEGCPACGLGLREFLTAAERDVVTTLCGRGVVQISPAERRGPVDLDAKLQAWRAEGLTAWRTGPVLSLDLGEVHLHLFASGRAIVKGTAEQAVAKGAYARYVLR
jgi:hypothetical protein